ncbi:MAG: SURF1 family protein [Pseudomonadota bacterium]
MPSTHRRVFRPAIVPTIATLVLAPALAGLGFWQLSRADDKQALIDSFEQGAVSTPQTAELATLDASNDRYRRVELSGTFDAERQVLLDSMLHEGRAGFHVLTPLRIEGADVTVMVNRGWVATTGQRQADANLAVGTEPRRVEGVVDRFPKAGLALGEAQPGSEWPRTLLFPQAAEISAELGYEVLPWQLKLDGDEADGFVRQWRPVTTFGPERHLGYAVQWFALCATLLIIFIAVNLKREAIQ